MKNWKHSCWSSVVSMRSYPALLSTHAPLPPLTHPPPSLFSIFSLPLSFSSFVFCLVVAQIQHGGCLSWIFPLCALFSSVFVSFSFRNWQTVRQFSPLFDQIRHLLWLCSGSRNLQFYRSLYKSNIPAWYLSVVLIICPFRTTPLLLTLRDESILAQLVRARNC